MSNLQRSRFILNGIEIGEAIQRLVAIALANDPSK